MIEYTLLHVLILELKIYCGPDKFYGRSKFGQYDEVKNRVTFYNMTLTVTFDLLLKNFNIANNFHTVRDTAFIFGMYIPHVKTLLLVH